MPALITILIFTSSLLFLYTILSYILLKPSTTHRLEKYLDIDNIHYSKDIVKDDKGKKIKKLHTPRLLNSLGKKLSEFKLLKGYIDKVQKDIIKAGLLLKGEEFLSIQLLCLLCIGLINFYINKSVAMATILGLVGWIVPSLIIRIKKKKRYKAFNEQLGDGIVLISNSLRAGYSFLQAVQSVATEMPDPISYEFRKLLKELRFGYSTERALENLLYRVESDDLELVVNAVMIQREIGGNLSEILDNISETIRERVKLKGEIRTLTAQGRISGVIISFLPVVLGLILYLMNPEYMMLLFNHQYGIMMLIASIINLIIGIIIINRIVNIEV
jgi:tight adherence protein B